MNKEVNIRSKKALSPVITTVLLVLLAIILAVIIFLWFRVFMGEQIEKFESPIEDKCSEVNIQASATGNSVYVNNIGTIPVYKVILRVDGLKEEPVTVQISEGFSKEVQSSYESLDGKEVFIIPILLGKVRDTGEVKEFECPKKDWKTLE